MLCPQLPRRSVSQFSVIPELVISCDKEDGGDGTFPMLPQLTGPGALSCKGSTRGFHPNPAGEEQVFLSFFLKGSGHKASALTVSTMCCGHLASAGGSSLFPKFAKVEAHGETAAAHTAGWAETLGEAPLKALSLLPAKGRDEWTGAPWQVPTSPVNEFPERERLRFCG